MQEPHTPTPLSRLLQKDVSRQEFLSVLGLGIISMLGLSSIIHFLTGKKHSTSISSTSSSTGYGSSPYGQ